RRAAAAAVLPRLSRRRAPDTGHGSLRDAVLLQVHRGAARALRRHDQRGPPVYGREPGTGFRARARPYPSDFGARTEPPGCTPGSSRGRHPDIAGAEPSPRARCGTLLDRARRPLLAAAAGTADATA